MLIGQSCQLGARSSTRACTDTDHENRRSDTVCIDGLSIPSSHSGEQLRDSLFTAELARKCMDLAWLYPARCVTAKELEEGLSSLLTPASHGAKPNPVVKPDSTVSCLEYDECHLGFLEEMQSMVADFRGEYLWKSASLAAVAAGVKQSYLKKIRASERSSTELECSSVRSFWARAWRTANRHAATQEWSSDFASPSLEAPSEPAPDDSEPGTHREDKKRNRPNVFRNDQPVDVVSWESKTSTSPSVLPPARKRRRLDSQDACPQPSVPLEKQLEDNGLSMAGFVDREIWDYARTFLLPSVQTELDSRERNVSKNGAGTPAAVVVEPSSGSNAVKNVVENVDDILAPNLPGYKCFSVHGSHYWPHEKETSPSNYQPILFSDSGCRSSKPGEDPARLGRNASPSKCSKLLKLSSHRQSLLIGTGRDQRQCLTAFVNRGPLDPKAHRFSTSDKKRNGPGSIWHGKDYSERAKEKAAYKAPKPSYRMAVHPRLFRLASDYIARSSYDKSSASTLTTLPNILPPLASLYVTDTHTGGLEGPPSLGAADDRAESRFRPNSLSQSYLTALAKWEPYNYSRETAPHREPCEDFVPVSFAAALKHQSAYSMQHVQLLTPGNCSVRRTPPAPEYQGLPSTDNASQICENMVRSAARTDALISYPARKVAPMRGISALTTPVHNLDLNSSLGLLSGQSVAVSKGSGDANMSPTSIISEFCLDMPAQKRDMEVILSLFFSVGNKGTRHTWSDVSASAKAMCILTILHRSLFDIRLETYAEIASTDPRASDLYDVPPSPYRLPASSYQEFISALICRAGNGLQDLIAKLYSRPLVFSLNPSSDQPASPDTAAGPASPASSFLLKVCNSEARPSFALSDHLFELPFSGFAFMIRRVERKRKRGTSVAAKRKGVQPSAASPGLLARLPDVPITSRVEPVYKGRAGINIPDDIPIWSLLFRCELCPQLRGLFSGLFECVRPSVMSMMRFSGLARSPLQVQPSMTQVFSYSPLRGPALSTDMEFSSLAVMLSQQMTQIPKPLPCLLGRSMRQIPLVDQELLTAKCPSSGSRASVWNHQSIVSSTDAIFSLLSQYSLTTSITLPGDPETGRTAKRFELAWDPIEESSLFEVVMNYSTGDKQIADDLCWTDSDLRNPEIIEIGKTIAGIASEIGQAELWPATRSGNGEMVGGLVLNSEKAAVLAAIVCIRAVEAGSFLDAYHLHSVIRSIEAATETAVKKDFYTLCRQMLMLSSSCANSHLWSRLHSLSPILRGLIATESFNISWVLVAETVNSLYSPFSKLRTPNQCKAKYVSMLLETVIISCAHNIHRPNQTSCLKSTSTRFRDSCESSACLYNSYVSQSPEPLGLAYTGGWLPPGVDRGPTGGVVLLPPKPEDPNGVLEQHGISCSASLDLACDQLYKAHRDLGGYTCFRPVFAEKADTEVLYYNTLVEFPDVECVLLDDMSFGSNKPWNVEWDTPDLLADSCSKEEADTVENEGETSQIPNEAQGIEAVTNSVLHVPSPIYGDAVLLSMNILRSLIKLLQTETPPENGESLICAAVASLWGWPEMNSSSETYDSKLMLSRYHSRSTTLRNVRRSILFPDGKYGTVTDPAVLTKALTILNQVCPLPPKTNPNSLDASGAASEDPTVKPYDLTKLVPGAVDFSSLSSLSDASVVSAAELRRWTMLLVLPRCFWDSLYSPEDLYLSKTVPSVTAPPLEASGANSLSLIDSNFDAIIHLNRTNLSYLQLYSFFLSSGLYSPRVFAAVNPNSIWDPAFSAACPSTVHGFEAWITPLSCLGRQGPFLPAGMTVRDAITISEKQNVLLRRMALGVQARRSAALLGTAGSNTRARFVRAQQRYHEPLKFDRFLREGILAKETHDSSKPRGVAFVLQCVEHLFSTARTNVKLMAALNADMRPFPAGDMQSVSVAQQFLMNNLHRIIISPHESQRRFMPGNQQSRNSEILKMIFGDNPCSREPFLLPLSSPDPTSLISRVKRLCGGCDTIPSLFSDKLIVRERSTQDVSEPLDSDRTLERRLAERFRNTRLGEFGQFAYPFSEQNAGSSQEEERGPPTLTQHFQNIRSFTEEHLKPTVPLSAFYEIIMSTLEQVRIGCCRAPEAAFAIYEYLKGADSSRTDPLPAYESVGMLVCLRSIVPVEGCPPQAFGLSDCQKPTMPRSVSGRQHSPAIGSSQPKLNRGLTADFSSQAPSGGRPPLQRSRPQAMDIQMQNMDPSLADEVARSRARGPPPQQSKPTTNVSNYYMAAPGNRWPVHKDNTSRDNPVQNISRSPAGQTSISPGFGAEASDDHSLAARQQLMMHPRNLSGTRQHRPAFTPSLQRGTVPIHPHQQTAHHQQNGRNHKSFGFAVPPGPHQQFFSESTQQMHMAGGADKQLRGALPHPVYPDQRIQYAPQLNMPGVDQNQMFDVHQPDGIASLAPHFGDSDTPALSGYMQQGQVMMAKPRTLTTVPGQQVRHESGQQPGMQAVHSQPAWYTQQPGRPDSTAGQQASRAQQPIQSIPYDSAYAASSQPSEDMKTYSRGPYNMHGAGNMRERDSGTMPYNGPTPLWGTPTSPGSNIRSSVGLINEAQHSRTRSSTPSMVVNRCPMYPSRSSNNYQMNIQDEQKSSAEQAHDADRRQASIACSLVQQSEEIQKHKRHNEQLASGTLRSDLQNTASIGYSNSNLMTRQGNARVFDMGGAMFCNLELTHNGINNGSKTVSPASVSRGQLRSSRVPFDVPVQGSFKSSDKAVNAGSSSNSFFPPDSQFPMRVAQRKGITPATSLQYSGQVDYEFRGIASNQRALMSAPRSASGSETSQFSPQLSGARQPVMSGPDRTDTAEGDNMPSGAFPLDVSQWSPRRGC